MSSRLRWELPDSRFDWLSRRLVLTDDTGHGLVLAVHEKEASRVTWMTLLESSAEPYADQNFSTDWFVTFRNQSAERC